MSENDSTSALAMPESRCVIGLISSFDILELRRLNSLIVCRELPESRQVGSVTSAISDVGVAGTLSSGITAKIRRKKREYKIVFIRLSFGFDYSPLLIFLLFLPSTLYVVPPSPNSAGTDYP